MKHSLIPFPFRALMVAAAVSTAASLPAAVISPQLGGSVDPSGGEDVDSEAVGSVSLTAFSALTGLVIQANWTGAGGTSGNTIDGGDVDVRIDHSPGFAASANSATAYNSSSLGNGYQWTGEDGQQVTIRFGTHNGSFTADRTVKAAGLMLLNFGGAYPDVTITYFDATNGVLSTQNFVGGADQQTSNGGDFFTGYTNSQEVIAKVTIDLTRDSGTSSIALDALAYLPLNQPPPVLVSTTPPDNATGVQTGDPLVATFNKDIQAGAGTITLKKSSNGSTVETFNVASSPRLFFSGETLTMDPSSDLDSDTEYHVLMDAGAVLDMGGIASAGLATATDWNFTSTRPRFLPTGNYNVLFISIDDLKANFGRFITPELAELMPAPVTPNLDSLAASGMSFTRAYCQQPVCWASRTSLLTGLRPDTTKVWDDGPLFRDTMPGVISLPQHFVQQGYRSAGYGKIYDFRSAGTDQDQPFSWPDGQSDLGVSHDNTGTAHNFYQDGHWQAEINAPTGIDNRRTLFATDAGVTNYWVRPARPVVDADYKDGLNTDTAIAQLSVLATEYQSSGTPFFLAMGFHLPHLPFTSPKSFWDLYDPSEIVLTNHVNSSAYTGTRTAPVGTLPFTAATQELNSYDDMPGNGQVTNPADARRLIHGYLAATSFADHLLGRLLAALDASGVANNTIIVVWGDHGWHLGDHNGFWCKHSTYEQAARSPLIICAPGMESLGTAGEICESPTEFVDIYPTLVELAGLRTPVQPPGLALEGSSLRPLLEDPKQPWKRGAFTQYNRNISGSGVTNPGQGMGYSIRTRRYRYTEWWRTKTSTTSGPYGLYSLDRDVKLFSSPEHVELYDMEADPNETVNQATNPSFAGLKAELSAALAGGTGWTHPPVAVPATYPTNFAAWQADLIEPGYPLATFAETLDPDGDGLQNLMEYDMGTHPLCPDADLPTSTEIQVSGTPYLALDYPLVDSRTDVATHGEMTADLATAWSTNGVSTDILGTNVNQTLWRSRIPMDGAVPPAGFLRLRSTD